MIIRFYLICIFLYATFSTNAQSINDFENLFVKAEENIVNQKFLDAEIIYERILFDSEDENISFKAIMAKTTSYKKQSKFLSACNFLQKNLNTLSVDSLKYKIYEQLIICSYLSNQLEQTVNLTEQTKVYFPNFFNYNRMIFLKILALNEQNKWIEAEQTFKELLRKNNFDTLYANIYKKLPKLKSSKKAEVLSTFLPGGGQFYANKPIEGLTSFLIQAIGAYYCFYSFQQQYYFSSWLVGLGIAGSFHFGSVRRAEELVRIYNLKKSSFYNSQLREKISNTLTNLIH